MVTQFPNACVTVKNKSTLHYDIWHEAKLFFFHLKQQTVKRKTCNSDHMWPTKPKEYNVQLHLGSHFHTHEEASAHQYTYREHSTSK